MSSNVFRSSLNEGLSFGICCQHFCMTAYLKEELQSVLLTSILSRSSSIMHSLQLLALKERKGERGRRVGDWGEVEGRERFSFPSSPPQPPFPFNLPSPLPRIGIEIPKPRIGIKSYNMHIPLPYFRVCACYLRLIWAQLRLLHSVALTQLSINIIHGHCWIRCSSFKPNQIRSNESNHPNNNWNKH